MKKYRSRFAKTPINKKIECLDDALEYLAGCRSRADNEIILIFNDRETHTEVNSYRIFASGGLGSYCTIMVHKLRYKII